MIDETHDPALTSWVESANRPGCDFPIQNLPLGVYRLKQDLLTRVGVAIGDFILDISPWLEARSLNNYMSLPRTQRRDLRIELSRALAKGATHRELVAQADCEMLLPANIGDYTDFYASIHHAMNAGRMFRPDNPLLPNYKHVPVAYHGRASSIVVSGTAVRRPVGQLGAGQFGATANFDYEVEIGAFIGPGNNLGEPIPICQAEEHIAGLCLVNDWSARDIQRWEYQPLGPFLGKNFATTVSPWMITLEALAPFRLPAPTHDIAPLSYLQNEPDAAFDIKIEAWLRSANMTEPVRLSCACFREIYWTFSQMVAHHTSNGCPLRPGDLIASGTVSGPPQSNRGCLLELAWNGTAPIHLPNGETRAFLQDGDEVILRGYCESKGFARISFGECRGVVAPARAV